MELIVVERDLPDGMPFESAQAMEDAVSWCLELHKVTFVRTFYSLEARRAFCIYRAPDAEAVREVQRQSGVPFTRIWKATEFAR